MIVTDTDKRTLLTIARKSVESAVRCREIQPLPSPSGELNITAGAFVTLWKGTDLRGCIGYIEAQEPLVPTLIDVASKAALNDPRFAPVSEKELDQIEIEISILTPKERITSIDQIMIGTHGLIVVARDRRGVLLPQVPGEYGWDRQTFVSQTCRKAGLPADAWKSEDVQLFIFSAIVFRERDIA
jgi:AmmeMemoRadiSam system protein A